MIARATTGLATFQGAIGSSLSDDNNLNICIVCFEPIEGPLAYFSQNQLNDISTDQEYLLTILRVVQSDIKK